ncbi:recombinase family protein [Bacillus cereus group sp. BY9-3LC]|uniref:recombinase family protein n=1 Tax=Bacillus cereus group sp. BY9-3LC TaxID=3018075 RepID=UPI0022E33370|nr:recombinase family protein [Bacillus cereus group sp. BY9-3LC]MDA1777965.1 recombinase family protein [Bacillus cereus group sp. BY9-3LC]
MIKTLQAVIYARVSTEEQATEGYSIKAQKDLLIKYAENNNLTIIADYIDEGKSGKSIAGRPQMLRLLEDAKQKKFDAVIVYKLDRLARKTRDSLEIVETLGSQGVQLISLSENIDTTTPHGKMFYTVLSSLAEMERDQIVGRVKMGMTQRAKEGKWNGGQCFGYDVKNKKLVQNVDETKVVREIFDYADQGFGYKKIVGILNRKGYITKRGNVFSIGTLKGILDNPVYIGKIRFNQYENWAEKRRSGKNKDAIIVDGEHEAIIPEDLWERVQQKRSARSYKAVQSDQPYILTKLIRCPQCGAGMVAGKSKGANKTYRYYKCGTFHNKGASECSANSINADVAELQVLEEFKRIVTESKFLQRLVQKMNKERENAKKPLIQEKKRLEIALNKCDKYIVNITDSLMKDPDLMPIFAEKLKEQQQAKLTFQQQLEETEEKLLNTSTNPIDLMALNYLVKNIDSILEQATSEEKKELLRMIIKEIEITPTAPTSREGRQITKIHLHFDFTPTGVKKKSKDLIRKMGSYAHDKKVDLSALDKQNPTDKEIRDTLKSLSILPSLMIRFPTINTKCPIHLLK